MFIIRQIDFTTSMFESNLFGLQGKSYERQNFAIKNKMFTNNSFRLQITYETLSPS